MFDVKRYNNSHLLGDIEIVDLLLKNGGDPNISDDFGVMPLHAAADIGSY